MRIEVAQQVLDFIGSLAPEPRRALRQSLRDLGREIGDMRPLEGDLDGFYRLRVRSYRIIFFYRTTARTRTIRCVFAERRAIIYEVFARQLHELLEP